MAERQAADQWVKVDGRRVFYRALPAGPAASGPPLLLIHGISCCTETWAPFIRALARRADAPALLVPDLPAHGRSEKPDRILGMADLASWTRRLLEHMDVGPVDAFGHSMGCQVALALAHRYPERVRRVALLGPTTGERHVSTPRAFFGLVGDSGREPLSYNLRLLRVFLRMGPPRYLLTAREMQRDDAFVRAPGVGAPTLVLQGARDAIIPKHVGEKLARALPRSGFAQVPGAAHAAQYSHPELTADRVLAFLAAE